jgi:3-deoxy-D-manno-octulosonic-acid transferase
MRFIYSLLLYLLAPVVCVVLLSRGFRDSRYWQNFSQRFGFGEFLPEPSIWVHAVSVGEVQAAAVLVRRLQQTYPGIPLVITTLTPTGDDRARVLFGEQSHVRYVPFDLPGSVWRFFNRVKPRIAVIFETELWPNLYHECGRRRVPLVLASARISPRSVGRYRRFLTLFREALSNGIVIAAQGEDDAERFRSIGARAERTHVTGNIKFDLALPPDTVAKGRKLRDRYAPGRPVWAAGSAHPGAEQEAILQAHRIVQKTHPNALLVLAPRHTNQFAEFSSWLEKRHVRFVKRSHGAACGAETEVLLVDSLGELLDFYAGSDVAFVGGTLVPVGGHNLLEPAALGIPVLAGPHNFNGLDIARLLVGRGAAELIPDGATLGQRVSALLSDPATRARMGEAGRASIEENRGALERLLGLIDPLLRAQPP